MPDTVLSVGNIKMDTVLSTGKMDTLKEHQDSVVKSGMATVASPRSIRPLGAGKWEGPPVAVNSELRL